jgi:hypothetical protein
MSPTLKHSDMNLFEFASSIKNEEEPNKVVTDRTQQVRHAMLTPKPMRSPVAISPVCTPHTYHLGCQADASRTDMKEQHQ